MVINMIAAIGRNNELGKDNKLIWNIKEDMKFFRDITMGHPIIMGRKTFESLPKPLPGRKNVVISKSEIINNAIEIYRSIGEFLNKYKEFNDDIFIIGGASIYRQFLDLASKLYLTEIDEVCEEADVYFPTFDKTVFDREVISENVENSVRYQHVLYKRK